MKNLFGDRFDFDRDGKMDSFEKRAEYTAILDEIRAQEGIEKPISEMNAEELGQLAAISGIDPGEAGF